jgi:hypothetical protein
LPNAESEEALDEVEVSSRNIKQYSSSVLVDFCSKVEASQAKRILWTPLAPLFYSTPT